MCAETQFISTDFMQGKLRKGITTKNCYPFLFSPAGKQLHLAFLVAGFAGSRPLTFALGLVAVYTQLVSRILAKSFNFTDFLCVAGFTVLFEKLLVFFVIKFHITHFCGKRNDISGQRGSCTENQKSTYCDNLFQWISPPSFKG
jgi:hypothetical protein